MGIVWSNQFNGVRNEDCFKWTGDLPQILLMKLWGNTSLFNPGARGNTDVSQKIWWMWPTRIRGSSNRNGGLVVFTKKIKPGERQNHSYSQECGKMGIPGPENKEEMRTTRDRCGLCIALFQTLAILNLQKRMMIQTYTYFLETGGSPSSVGIGWTASEIIRASPRQVHDNELKQLKDEISAKNSQLKELKQAADWISGWFFFETSGDLSILRRVWDRFSGDFGVAFVCGPGSFEWVGSTWV